jgi:DNA-binding transcriptional regulator LsrR (DeoR family)
MEEHELLQAVLEARLDSADDDGAMTAREIATKTGMTIPRVRLMLDDLRKQKKITVMWTKRDTLTTPLTGTMTRVPGYVFVREE